MQLPENDAAKYLSSEETTSILQYQQLVAKAMNKDENDQYDLALLAGILGQFGKDAAQKVLEDAPIQMGLPKAACQGDRVDLVALLLADPRYEELFTAQTRLLLNVLFLRLVKFYFTKQNDAIPQIFAILLQRQLNQIALSGDPLIEINALSALVKSLKMCAIEKISLSNAIYQLPNHINLPKFVNKANELARLQKRNDLYALVVSYSDAFLQAKRDAEIKPEFLRFFEIMKKLPLDAQGLVCRRYVGDAAHKPIAGSQGLEASFRKMLKN